MSARTSRGGGTTPRTAGARLAALAAAASAAFALAACSGSASPAVGDTAAVGSVGVAHGGTTGAGSASSTGSTAAVPAPFGAPAVASSPTSPTSPGVDLLTGRSVVRTAALTLRVRDVLAASARAGALASALGGFVAGEQTQAAPDQPAKAEADLTLRVPAAQLPLLVSQLRGLGTLVTEGQNAQDVTGQVIDVQARISAQRASVARISTLMARATSLGQVVLIEGELTRRQANLESLQGQAAALADQTALGTVTATLFGPAATPVATKAPPTPAGFGAGLSRGWHGFATAGTWLLTALGTAVPFSLLAVPLAALVALLRRRQAGEPVEAGPPLPPAATA
jgi:Domain of unknown function (DUF4349)